MSVNANATDPAFPVADYGACQLPGLTKRELFAAMVLQGFAACPHIDGSPKFLRDHASRAVEWADALLAELAKVQS